MIAKGLPIRVGVLATLVLVFGCAGEPYVLNAEEFNREIVYFVHGYRIGRLVKSVTINANHAEAIQELAVNECRRYGRAAAFSKTDYNVCPLTTPVAAVYDASVEKDDGWTGERTGS